MRVLLNNQRARKAKQKQTQDSITPDVRSNNFRTIDFRFVLEISNITHFDLDDTTGK